MNKSLIELRQCFGAALALLNIYHVLKELRWVCSVPCKLTSYTFIVPKTYKSTRFIVPDTLEITMKARANTKYIKLYQESSKQTLFHQTDAMEFLVLCLTQHKDLHACEI